MTVSLSEAARIMGVAYNTALSYARQGFIDPVRWDGDKPIFSDGYCRVMRVLLQMPTWKDLLRHYTAKEISNRLKRGLIRQILQQPYPRYIEMATKQVKTMIKSLYWSGQYEAMAHVTAVLMLGETLSPELMDKYAPYWEDILPKATPPVKKFVHPTLEEVKEYAQQRSSWVDPVRFHAYYEARGWMVGSSKMKKWEAAFQLWERNERKPRTSAGAAAKYEENIKLNF